MVSTLYQEMDTTEFYGYLVEKISKDRRNAPAFIKKLKEYDNYENDFVFRTIADTVEVANDYLSGRYQEIIPAATSLIERASTLGLWTLTTRNLNMLGASYQLLEILEKAFECYSEVIKIENEQGYVDVSPLAYNNIGLMYLNLESYKKAARYFDLAVAKEGISVKNCEKGDVKFVSFRANQSIAHSFMGHFDEAKEILDIISKKECEQIGADAKYFIYTATMIYYFHICDYEKAKEYFDLGMKECASKRHSWNKSILIEFIRLSDKMKLNYSFYKDAFEEFEKLPEDEYTVANANVLYIIRKYYRRINDKPRYESATVRYLKALRRNGEHNVKKQVEALELLDSLIEESKAASKMRVMNKELKRLADEAIKNKKKLQVANERLHLVHEIGKKLTSSLDLAKVIDLIHEGLHKNVPFDTFVIMLAEPEKERLRTLAYYFEKKLQPEVSLSIDNPDSIFVHCYKTGETIVSDDILKDVRFLAKKPIYSGRIVSMSCIYMPLKVDEKLVGVCSVQSKREAVYKEEHVEFLEMFLPYLSISVNNAVYSEKLESAIQFHLKVQEELKKANRRLEQLSSLDGLTKISNRRDFERRILKLISIAQKEEKAVSILMMDIDNFKVYNDTYGHPEGDDALKKVAAVIRTVLDEVDGLSARFGGEEFVGACSGFSKEEIKKIGEKICKKVFDKNILNERTKEGRLTLSVGIAYSEPMKEVIKSELMKAADDALYEAKKNGKNRVVLAEV